MDMAIVAILEADTAEIVVDRVPCYLAAIRVSNPHRATARGMTIDARIKLSIISLRGFRVWVRELSSIIPVMVEGAV